jgi:putative membrane protein
MEKNKVIDISFTNKIYTTMEWNHVLASVVFSLIGIIVLGICFWIFEKVTPENIWKEIIEKQNMALAVVSAAFMIAMAIIIGAAVQS